MYGSVDCAAIVVVVVRTEAYGHEFVALKHDDIIEVAAVPVVEIMICAVEDFFLILLVVVGVGYHIPVLEYDVVDVFDAEHILVEWRVDNHYVWLGFVVGLGDRLEAGGKEQGPREIFCYFHLILIGLSVDEFKRFVVCDDYVDARGEGGKVDCHCCGRLALADHAPLD